MQSINQPHLFIFTPYLMLKREGLGPLAFRLLSTVPYCRMQLGKKRTIFDKIAVALNKSLS